MLQLPFVKDILFCLTAQNNINIKVSTLAILKGPGIHKITNMSQECLENIWKMTGICLENVFEIKHSMLSEEPQKSLNNNISLFELEYYKW